jgi:hypothetical protein
MLQSGQLPTVKTMRDKRKRYLESVETHASPSKETSSKLSKKRNTNGRVVFDSNVTLYHIGKEWVAGKQVKEPCGIIIPIVDRLGYENKEVGDTFINSRVNNCTRPSQPCDYRSVDYHHVGRSSSLATYMDPVTGRLGPMSRDCGCKKSGIRTNVCRSFRCDSKEKLEDLLQAYVHLSSWCDVSSSGGTVCTDDKKYCWGTFGVVLHVGENDEGDPFRWSNQCSDSAFWIFNETSTAPPSHSV